MENQPKVEDAVADAKQIFLQRFGRAPKFVVAAPGRVNLIGEHTDYNGGFVLPMAIGRYTVLAADKCPGNETTIFSTAFDESATFPSDGSAPEPPAEKSSPGSERRTADVDWPAYVRGVVALAGEFGAPSKNESARAIGAEFALPAFEAIIHSTIPIGSGLSSSAALEAAAATLVESITKSKFDPIQKALLCQNAEHRFAGVPCGIMDQITAVLARDRHLLRIDCQSLDVEHIPFDDANAAILIINSEVGHRLASSEYSARRTECADAASKLGVRSLRDSPGGDIDSQRPLLDPTACRRVRHVVTENARVLAAADAVRKTDWATVGALMYASHDSLRDDYEVSCRELDILVRLARELGDENGVYGARMTGGGFGGSVACLVDRTKMRSVVHAVAAKYVDETGIEPTIFPVTPVRGACAF